MLLLNKDFLKLDLPTSIITLILLLLLVRTYYLISETNHKECMGLQEAGLASLARAKPSNWELMGRREKLIAIRETTGYWPIVVTRSSQYCHCYFCLKSGEERRDKWWSDQQVENVIIITRLANDLLLQNIFWRKGWMNLTVFCCRNNSRNHRH